MSDHFSDFDEDTTSSSYIGQEDSSAQSIQSRPGNGNGYGEDDSNGEGSRGYSQEVFSEKISAKYRTFFIDVKENTHGHLVKVSEKSRGRKSTIMMDAEDLDDVITALTNARNFIVNQA